MNEILVFLGTNFEDMNDFDAQIELLMGGEDEKHLITTSRLFTFRPGSSITRGILPMYVSPCSSSMRESLAEAEERRAS
jgi:hypothetical protein